MLAAELAESQARAELQAQQRTARHQARSRSPPPSTTSLLAASPPHTNNNIMEAHQLAKIIDSIPSFSGESRDNIQDWLEIVSLKFDLLGYDTRQKRRFIPQYLSGDALKWHLANRERLATWEEYIAAII